MEYLNIIHEAKLTTEEEVELSNLLGRFRDWYDDELPSYAISMDDRREIVGTIRWELKKLKNMLEKFNNRAIDNVEDEDLKQRELLRKFEKDCGCSRYWLGARIETRGQWEELNQKDIEKQYDKMRYCILYQDLSKSKRLVATARSLEAAFMISEQIPGTVVTEQEGVEISKEDYKKYQEELQENREKEGIEQGFRQRGRSR